MKGKKLKRVQNWVVLIFWGVQLTLHAEAERFVELTVQIQTDFWNWSYKGLDNERGYSTISEPKSNSIFGSSRKLKCVVGTNSWMIEGEPGAISYNARDTFWFTGTNIIQHWVITGVSNKIPASTNETITESNPPVGQQWTRIWQSRDGNPGRSIGEANLLPTPAMTCWLAFCSGSFLKRPGRGIPLPSDSWKEYLSDAFRDETRTFDDELGLPQSIKQFAETNQTILQYQVQRSTNLLGWNIPMKFILIQYNPTGTNGWQVHYTAKGIATFIGVGSKPAVPPAEPRGYRDTEKNH